MKPIDIIEFARDAQTLLVDMYGSSFTQQVPSPLMEIPRPDAPGWKIRVIVDPSLRAACVSHDGVKNGASIARAREVASSPLGQSIAALRNRKPEPCNGIYGGPDVYDGLEVGDYGNAREEAHIRDGCPACIASAKWWAEWRGMMPAYQEAHRKANEAAAQDHLQARRALRAAALAAWGSPAISHSYIDHRWWGQAA